MADDDSVAAQSAAALLGSAGRVVNGWSMAFALGALVLIGLQAAQWWSLASLCGSLFVGLAQMYFALRVAFDAAVFEHLQGEPAHYAAFDRLLAQWGMKNASDETRPIDSRVRGAMALLRQQAISFVVQTVLLFIDLAAIVYEAI